MLLFSKRDEGNVQYMPSSQTSRLSHATGNKTDTCMKHLFL